MGKLIDLNKTKTINSIIHRLRAEMTKTQCSVEFTKLDNLKHFAWDIESYIDSLKYEVEIDLIRLKRSQTSNVATSGKG